MIEVRGLTFSYPASTRPALSDVSLSIAPGAIMGLVGPAGSGKTTLLRILAGSIREYAGTVKFRDKDYLAWSRDFYEHVGASWKSPGLFPKLSAVENLTFHRGLYRNGGESVKPLLERIGLSGVAMKPVETLAPGLKKRLDIARALLPWPDVALLDEPFADSDKKDAAVIREMIAAHKSAGRAAILAMRNASTCAGLCDAIAELAEGGILRVTGNPQP